MTSDGEEILREASAEVVKALWIHVYYAPASTRVAAREHHGSA